MTDKPSTTSSPVPTDSAFIAAVWEQPNLCLAFFGVQIHTEEGARLYNESGINDEVPGALADAFGDGLLHNRMLMSDEGPVLMQYWRSYEDLDRWARQLPHTKWWKWLVQNAGQGISFYHEIYRVRTGEAIYEQGSIPVGPGRFTSLVPVRSGEGQSKVRQERFADAQATGSEK